MSKMMFVKLKDVLQVENVAFYHTAAEVSDFEIRI